MTSTVLSPVAAGSQRLLALGAADLAKTLLHRSPHLVLDGLALAAGAVGARRVYLYLPAQLVPRVRQALAERAATRRDRYPVRMVQAPDRFVAGQETAVISRVGGGAAVPKDLRNRPTEAGLAGAPTLVQNVETLAHLALIARHGAGWFRAVGTDEQPGTFLATVSGAVARPGVYEAAYGIRLGDLLALAGGPDGDLRAVLVGGYHGTWLPVAALSAGVDRAALAPYGASPGAGVVVAQRADGCGLAQTAGILSYLAEQTAGQCGPCRYGLPVLAGEFADLARPRRRDGRLPGRIAALTRLVQGRGACHHPDGTTRLALSALSVFSDDVAAHLAAPVNAGGSPRGRRLRCARPGSPHRPSARRRPRRSP
jgi:NADH:ubiquinone oxidoreductase subunit F (NADH-binding)